MKTATLRPRKWRQIDRKNGDISDLHLAQMDILHLAQMENAKTAVFQTRLRRQSRLENGGYPQRVALFSATKLQAQCTCQVAHLNMQRIAQRSFKRLRFLAQRIAQRACLLAGEAYARTRSEVVLRTTKLQAYASLKATL